MINKGTSDVEGPANTRRWPNVALALGQRRRRWANVSPTLGQRQRQRQRQRQPNIVFAGPVNQF